MRVSRYRWGHWYPLALLAWSAVVAPAHDSPEHVVTALTEQMQRSGVTATLLHQRAIEYRALGDLEAATSDLVRAKTLQPESWPILQELCRIQHSAGKFQAALDTINYALGIRSLSTAGELLILRAEILLDSGGASNALADCATAFSQPEPPLEWYLIRSRAQSTLGQHAARARDLREGFDRTGSSILKLEWVDALIDAKQFAPALAETDLEIETSRWRSTWLLRRGQIRLGMGNRKDGEHDLREAIMEIDQRLNPTRPDVTLLADRGLAWALLEKPEAARRDLNAAIAAGADEWVVRPLKRRLPPPMIPPAP